MQNFHYKNVFICFWLSTKYVEKSITAGRDQQIKLVAQKNSAKKIGILIQCH